jgi:hypothetical protein
MPDPEIEKLLHEYEQVNENFRMLADIRFKLLALVPALGGAAAFVLSGFALSTEATAPPHSLVFLIAALGFLATLGITIYDQRNSELYNALGGRAKDLEILLDLPGEGQFRQRPDRDRYFFGLFPMGHDIGLSVIYGPVLGAWAFPIVYVLHDHFHWYGNSRYVAVAIASLMVIVFTMELLRLDHALPWQMDVYEGNLTAFNQEKGTLELTYVARNLPRTFKCELTGAWKEAVTRIQESKKSPDEPVRLKVQRKKGKTAPTFITRVETKKHS